MKEKNKNLEDILKDLEKLKKSVDESERNMQEFQHRVAVFATEVAFELYPELKDMDSKQILHFGDRMTRHTDKLALDIDNLVYQMTKD